MRKAHPTLFATALLATLFILCAAGESLAVTTTFTVRLPDRSPQIKRVKVLLELASDPAASTVAINGNPAGGIDCLLQAAGLDLFTFKRISGTNSVVLELIDQTRFPNPADLCTANAGDKDFAVTFEGPAVTGFRLVGYSVPGAAGIPALDCTQAKRRVNSTPAFFQVVPTSGGNPVGTPKGRFPLDIILVLDKSGSMAWDLPGPSAEIRWDVLKTSLEQFIAIWKTEGFTALTTTGGFDLSADRLGLTFFDNDSTPPNAGGNVTFVQRGANGVAWDTNIMGTGMVPAAGTVNAVSPGGGTAMGLGVKKGINSWLAENSAVACVGGTAPAIGNSSDATTLLMTDGEQNIAPEIVEVGGKMELDFGAGNVPLIDKGIPIQTVGLRPPGDPTAILLDKVSKQTAGAAMLPSTSAGMAQSFAQGLVESLKGNTLSVLSQQENTLAANVLSSAQSQVNLDASTRRAVFVLGWEGGRNANGLDLRISKPDGSITEPIVRYDGTFWTVQAVDVPATGPIGDWGYKVVRKSQNSAPFVAPYHLSVYAYEGRLSYRINFPPNQAGTGDAITMNVEVSYDGKPLTGLGDALKVRIARPTEGFGTILFKSKVSGEVLTSERPGGKGDTTTPLQRKVENLANTTDFLKRVEPVDLPNVFTLRDSGSAADSDLRADDGIYSTSFSDTTRPGLYRFKVALEWNDPRTGRVHRIENVERTVKVTPDAASSEVTMTVDRATRDYIVSVIPRDRFGNYLGPGLSHLIDVSSNGRRASAPADTQQTGDYIVRLSLLDPTKPIEDEVIVTVDGKTIKGGKPGGTKPILPTGSGDIPADAAEKRWGLSLHAGANFPHSDFNDFFNTGFSFNADLEYRLSNHVSLEALYGYHRFPTEFFSAHLDLHQLSGNVKVFGGNTSVRPFINGGGGVYHFNGGGGGDTRGGANIGGGLQFNLTPTFAVEGAYNFHTVFTPGSNVKFSTLQGGVRFRF